MQSYTTTQARKYLSKIMDIVMKGEPVIITRRGGSAAVLVSREAFDIWQEVKQGVNFSGDTLAEQNKHWFRAKFLMQYRLFFRFSEQHKTIILAWMNDAETKRLHVSKRDAYKVFSGMLHNGYPPDDWALLLKQSQDWDNTNS